LALLALNEKSVELSSIESEVPPSTYTHIKQAHAITWAYCLKSLSVVKIWWFSESSL